MRNIVFVLAGVAAAMSVACKKEAVIERAADPALGQELIAVIEKGDEARAFDLMKQGADINARQKGTAYTPYVIAAKSCLTTTVRRLEERGADLTLEVSSANTVVKSAFLNAAMAGCLDTMRYFVEEKNMDINTRHHVWNETILHKAVQKHNAALARYALERGVDRNIKDNNQRTALDLAKEIGATEVAALIEKYPVK
jgi:ankyrin repeat protein